MSADAYRLGTDSGPSSTVAVLSGPDGTLLSPAATRPPGWGVLRVRLTGFADPTGGRCDGRL
ncbi:hypothetical protein ACPPVO_36700 [Dactylosporangium sp. McL0621]|uniref:hypothetical protein n=1 Tax=Dactylosporangium sp. McL0621 TaxID=3415678 RepID=UPI003CFB4B23